MPQQCRPPPPFTRIIDTGTSHHNLALGDGNPQHYILYTTNAPQVMIPNGANITAHAQSQASSPPDICHLPDGPPQNVDKSCHLSDPISTTDSLDE